MSVVSNFRPVLNPAPGSATQNMCKYTHIENCRFSRTLLTASPCMLLTNRSSVYSQVLVHSTVVNSPDSPGYILTVAFNYAIS